MVFSNPLARGTIEYLLIIAFFVIISIVVGLVISQTGSSGNISSSVSNFSSFSPIFGNTSTVANTFLSPCTGSDWEYTISPTTCQFNGQQTNTWNKIDPSSVLSLDKERNIQLSATTATANGELTTIGGIRVLKLWGTNYQKGYAHGYLLADNIVHLMNNYMFWLFISNVENYNALISVLQNVADISQENLDELDGMMAGISASGANLYIPKLGRNLNINDLKMINLLADTFEEYCSSFSAWGNYTSGGNTISARNLDYGPPNFPASNLWLLIVNYPKDSSQKKWVSIAVPGMIGVLTGMSEDGLGLYMNSVMGVGYSPAGMRVSPVTLVAREALLNAGGNNLVDDVAATFSGKVTHAGYIFHVTSPSNQKDVAAVIEGNLRGGQRRDSIDTASYFSIGSTNHWIKRTLPPPQGSGIGDSVYRYNRLNSVGAYFIGSGDGVIDLAEARTIINSVALPVSHEFATHFTLLFQPDIKEFYLKLNNLSEVHFGFSTLFACTTSAQCRAGQVCTNGACCTVSSYIPALSTFCGSKTVMTNCNTHEVKVGTLTCSAPQICSNNACIAPPCTESNWASSLSPETCPSSGQQTKTWTKIGTCTSGVTHVSSEIVSCNYQTPTCTSFSYSNWDDCTSSGTQSRQVLSLFPSGCQGGNPVINQPCIYVPPSCTSFTYSGWSDCNASGKQTRELLTSNPSGCIGGTPEELIQNCTPICTGFTYSDWGNCNSSGLSIRTVLTRTPQNCTAGNVASLIQSCTPTCNATNYDYHLFPLLCPENEQQTKKYFKLGICIEGTTQPQDTNVSCKYNLPSCTYTYEDWSICYANSTQIRSLLSKTPQDCQGTPQLVRACNYYVACTESDWISTDSSCTSNNTKTRNWTKTSTCLGGTTHPTTETITCTFITTPVTCTSATYTSWSDCNLSGQQIRTIVSKNPEGCVEGVANTIIRKCTTIVNCTGTICEGTCYKEKGICCNNTWNKDLTTCDFAINEISDQLNENTNPIAKELIIQAQESLANGEVLKARAEAQTALLESKISDTSPPELIESLEQAHLALNQKDYSTAEKLSVEALIKIKETPTQIFDLNNPTNQLFLAVTILTILTLFLTVFSRKKR